MNAEASLSPAPSAVRAVGLTQRFGGPSGPAVLSGLSFELPPGSHTAITGPSGSGKTSLLRILAGLATASEGSLEVLGFSPGSASTDERARWRRGKLGIVFQHHELLDSLTCAENVELALRIAEVPASERADRVAHALQEMEVIEFAGQRPSELSGGQVQRVGIARAVAVEPRLYLVDEPTSSLDSATAAQALRSLVGTARRTGATLVVATHDPLVTELMDHELELGNS